MKHVYIDLYLYTESFINGPSSVGYPVYLDMNESQTRH